MLILFNQWFDSHYEKIWVILTVITILMFIIGMLLKNEMITGIGEDLTDYYDEILAE